MRAWIHHGSASICLRVAKSKERGAHLCRCQSRWCGTSPCKTQGLWWQTWEWQRTAANQSAGEGSWPSWWIWAPPAGLEVKQKSFTSRNTPRNYTKKEWTAIRNTQICVAFNKWNHRENIWNYFPLYECGALPIAAIISTVSGNGKWGKSQLIKHSIGYRFPFLIYFNARIARL